MKDYSSRIIDAEANTNAYEESDFDSRNDDSDGVTPVGFTNLSFAIIRQFGDRAQDRESELLYAESKI